MSVQMVVFEPLVEQEIADLIGACKGPYLMQDGSGCGMTDNHEIANRLKDGFPRADGSGKVKAGSRGTYYPAASEPDVLWYDLTYPKALIEAWENATQAPF